MSAFMLPLRPLKLRVVEVMQTSRSDRNPTRGWQMPQPGVMTCTPASSSVSIRPSFTQRRYTACEAGDTRKRTPLATLRPFSIRAAISMSSNRPFAHEPICA